MIGGSARCLIEYASQIISICITKTNQAAQNMCSRPWAHAKHMPKPRRGTRQSAFQQYARVDMLMFGLGVY